MRQSAEPMARRSLIPWLFPAALLPVLAANGALVYFALQSKPALVAAHPFEDGRGYNRELTAAAAQAKLGWTGTLSLPARAQIPALVELAVQDRNGTPVVGLAVELWGRRPVGSLPDRRLTLTEASAGHYAATVTLPMVGQWQFDAVARRGDVEFVHTDRAVLR